MEKVTQTDTQQLLEKARSLLAEAKTAELENKLQSLQQQASTPGFWDKSEAQQVMQQVSTLQHQLKQYQQLSELKNDLEAYLELTGEVTPDKSENLELNAEFSKIFHQLNKAVKQVELDQYLTGKYDQSGVLFSIHAGQGGTEAMDWAEMLQRMYTRYFEKKGWKYKFITENRGDEAGIKAVSYEVEAPYCYGYLKHEHGTHRLVRLSPFNADNLRQTSFALVEVLPIIDNKADIQLKEEDLSWQFTRAGGAGGQSVNKVNSAVELTHKPSGLVVRCREERSQIQNKERAIKILKAKLAKLEDEKQQSELKQAKGKHQDASWGSQIRNYILHPYQLVKDTRTNVETADTEGVLDGEIDRFIEAGVRLRV